MAEEIEYIGLSKDEDTFVQAEAIEDENIEKREIAIRANDSLAIDKISNPEVFDTYVYSFKQGSKQVIGLGAKGVDCICNWLGNIKVRLIESQTGEDEDNYFAAFEAEDLVSETNAFAKVVEPKFNPDGSTNKFADRKCWTKAQRNAKLKVIPTDVLAKLVYRFNEIKEGHEKVAAQTGIELQLDKLNIRPDQFTDFVRWKFNKDIYNLELDELKYIKGFLTRPIGEEWFTATYPLLVQLLDTAEKADKLDAAKSYLVKKYKTLADVPQDVIKDSISRLR